MKKEFKTRDGATAFCRANGVQKDLYNNFITKINDVYIVDTNFGKVASTSTAPNKTAKPFVTKGLIFAGNSDKEIREIAIDFKPNGKSLTVSSLSRELIYAGKTNKEIWNIIKAEFELDDKKKSYPAWYRSQMKREGLI